MGSVDSSRSAAVFAQLRACRVVPVVKLPSVEVAEPLADAFEAAGITAIEVTFRSDAAVGAIERLSRRSGLLVGAGTVRSVAQARAAERAGAAFVVSPGTRPDVVEYCRAADIPVSPGVCTPTEVEQALDLGVTLLKFFPASLFGGVATLQSFGSVFPEVQFFPTGGIKPENLAEYLAQANVLCCGGTWLAPTELLSERKFAEIEARAKQARQIAGR
jgi:2-dehydro-3-deoxyphosphogluconate aldolase / (4S)-4-hydroxy-2-oxoglutarate aldolase